MSAHYWRNEGRAGKSGFVSLQNSYHGETLGALSVTDVALFRSAYSVLLKQHDTVPSPDWRKAGQGESAEEFALRCAEMLENHFRQHHESLAAFVIEPLVQGAAGMAMYHPIYLQRARELCDRYQVHLVADEIAVGMGRTGTMFACEQGGIRPDFLCLSKGISGGYLPLSVVMSTDTVYQSFYSDETARGFLHSHSYTGNPLACRAALATLDIFEQDDVLNANRNMAERFNDMLRPLAEHPKVRNFRNTGMIWAFEVGSPHGDFAQRCFRLALEQELLLRPMGNTVYFMPPYVIRDEDLGMLAGRALEIVEQLG